MKFVKLTHVHFEKPIFINFDLVESFKRQDETEETCVTTLTDLEESYYPVVETPEEILDLLKG